MRKQIAVALLQRVETRRRAQRREVWGSDMGRHKERVRVGFQADFQQIATVESEDRPTVRMQIANGAQPLVETRDRIQARENNYVVNLAGLFALLV